MKGQFAVTLAAALLAAGCSHHPPPSPQARIEADAEAARRELRAIVQDPGRAARADAALVRLQRIMTEAATAAEASRRRIDALDRRHDASTEEFRAVLAAADAAWLEQLRDAAAVREELAGLLTPEEWQRSAAARGKLLKLQLGPQPL